ncbi:MAG TPA: pyruvate kinase [Fibrobacter sp.]|nr:pyruvate kinase [Fibrobacter sp.]
MITNSRTHTKIVATVGPTSSDKVIMAKMIEEGVNVFRLNFSHSNREEHLKVINIIKELNNELGSHVSILADLQGPKLRIGEVENNLLMLEVGDDVTFVTEKGIGTKDRLYITYADFPKDVQAGEFVLIDDGKIKLEVIQTNGIDSVTTRVLNGGPLSSKKGVNLPQTRLSLPCLTEEDKINAAFALEQGVDWIALSFVRAASDITVLRDFMKSLKGEAGIIAKIEKPEALVEIDEIIKLSDGIMVARGDLGVEIPFDQVPVIQKQLVKKCIESAKPVIIATQMMESMITNFSPTRAEATDVANAVLDGADALMLSGETAVGKYPIETISNMRAIINYAERNGQIVNRYSYREGLASSLLADSICTAATELAHQIKAKAIVAFTHSGLTAFRLASHRPESLVIAFTDNPLTLNQLSLVWGVTAVYMPRYDVFNAVYPDSMEILKQKGWVKSEDILVYVASIPLKAHGTTNMLKVGAVP